MKFIREFVTSVVVGGLLVVLPIYLAVLLLLKATKVVLQLVHPVAELLPAGIPAPDVFSLMLVLIVCAAVGLVVRTHAGGVVRERIETFLGRLPGYSLFRSLTQQLAGKTQDSVWKPALVEIEDALMPAFIVEEFEDGRYTIFVPSVPTPLAGAVYVLGRERVHPVDVPLTQAVRSISQWG